MPAAVREAASVRVISIEPGAMKRCVSQHGQMSSLGIGRFAAEDAFSGHGETSRRLPFK